MADYTAKRFDEMASKMGGAFVLARSSLGVTSFGMQILNLPPDAGEHYPNHDHLADGQEEVYVVLGGGGQIVIDDDERVELGPDMAVRVGPAAKRQVFSGDQGIRMLILGGTPGEAYDPPGFTEPPADEPGG